MGSTGVVGSGWPQRCRCPQNRAERLAFMQLVAHQVADCGIALEPVERSFDDISSALSWPLKYPGEDRPWDLIFNGYIMGPSSDPGLDGEVIRMQFATYPCEPGYQQCLGLLQPGNGCGARASIGDVRRA